MSKPKFIYFDVGGVLLLDFSGTDKWDRLKQDLGITPEKDAAFEAVWQRHLERVCVDCDVDHILDQLAAAAEIELPADYSLLADVVSRFEQNRVMWQVAEQAMAYYSVGLLTNQCPRMLSTIYQQQLLPRLDWQVVVDSSEVGFQKPEAGIFEIAEQMSGVGPSELFFVDNSPGHLAEAEARGWQTMLYDHQNPEDSARQVAERLGL